MGVFSSIFRRNHVTLQFNGYYDDDEPMEGWESLPYPFFFDKEDEGEFNRLCRVWKETKRGGFFVVRREHDNRSTSFALAAALYWLWPNQRWKRSGRFRKRSL